MGVVVFSENFLIAPNAGQSARRVGGWVPTDINNADLEFGQWNKGFLSLLAMGSYQVKLGPRYVTNMRQTEFDLFLEGNPDYNINWQQWHRECSTLPQNKMVFFKDEFFSASKLETRAIWRMVSTPPCLCSCSKSSLWHKENNCLPQSCSCIHSNILAPSSQFCQ